VAASPRPDNSIGHQGLFFYRFDGADSLSLNALGLYFNRNRWYSPTLGRFTSRDPKATQLPRPSIPESAGSVRQFSPRRHFSDGLNLYWYAGATPVVRRDPTGLFSLLEMGVSSSISGMLGGMFAGVSSYANGGDFGDGFWRGFKAGAIGGAGGYAFAASASGFLGAIVSEKVAELVAGGFASGAISSGLNTYLLGGSLQEVLTNALYGGLLGAGANAAAYGGCWLSDTVRYGNPMPADILGEVGSITGSIFGSTFVIWWNGMFGED